ncbi:MAG: hypothetical protein H6732_04780 [Alphaproteobacteria bacterium]|nr:hypothetical protein [Alphaproteobacteria bacterium]
MSTHLALELRLHDAVVEHRIVRLRDGAWVGDRADAAVIFPGPVLQLRRRGDAWTLGGHLLRRDLPVVIELGDVRVRASLAEVGSAHGVLAQLPDPVPMVLTLALLLLGASAEVGRRVVDSPDVSAQLHALVVGQAARPVAAEGRSEPQPEEPWRPAVGLSIAP